MRAAVVRNVGAPENIEIIDTAMPFPENGQLRIKVVAAGVNPVDLVTRSGMLHEIGAIAADQTQVGLGWEVSGTVDEIGPQVTNFQLGDRVIALSTDFSVPVAGYAEYLVVDAVAAAAIPDDLDLRDAAALPLNTLTADQALSETGLERGQTLLVTGAAGSVGGYVVQLAALRGIDVVAVASQGDETAVRRFGARSFIDRSDDLADAVLALHPGGVDAAVDAAILVEPVLASLTTGGTYVGVRPFAIPDTDRELTVRAVNVTADGARLAELAALTSTADLDVRVTEVLPLADAARAHALAEKGGLRGRIILTP